MKSSYFYKVMDLDLLNKEKLFTGKVCPYCGKPTEYVDSSVVFSRSYGPIYICKPCEAWVGVHKGTDRALGRLAKEELRILKMQAHSKFDKLWKQLLVLDYPLGEARRYCYTWLSEKMKLPFEWTHIGMFDEQQCMEVIEHVKALNMNGGISMLVTEIEKQGYIKQQADDIPIPETGKAHYLYNVKKQLEEFAKNLQVTFIQLQPTQLRLEDGDLIVDIYPVNRRYHILTTNKTGTYGRLDDFINGLFKVAE